MNSEVKKKKGKKKKRFKFLLVVSIIVSIITVVLLGILNVLPILYYLLVILGFFIYDFLSALLLLSKGWKRRLFGTFLAFVKLVVCIVIAFYLNSTIGFLNKINKGGNFNTKNYSVVVINSNYKSIKDIKDKKIGIIKLGDDKGLEDAKSHLNKKTSLEYVEFDDLTKLLTSLLNSSLDAILVEEAEKNLLEEDNHEFLQKRKVIYDFSIDVLFNDGLVKNVDVTKDAFNIFISGMDSYGKITSVSRSDVNMLVTINPKTHTVLLTSIPRDYYVKLHGINTTYKDKLTHAGIHGIDTSVKTVEDLFNIDINYYAKVNFTSLIEIVDKLGGIDVTLDEPFRAYYIEEEEEVNYQFKKGVNHLNGKQALAFARERKSILGGDVKRVEHQQILLEGIINKLLSKNIINKYNDLLKALENKVVTNLGTENITNLVKMQLKDMPSWTIERCVLNGSDAHEFTYSYKTSKAYVMIPNEDDVNNAKEKINNMMKN